MSNKTTNLGLSLVDTASENSVTFADWRRNINAKGTSSEKSDFELIDEFAGHIYGRSGTVSIAAANWNTSTKTYTVNVADLGATDAIFFAPKTSADQDQLNKSRCTVTANGSAVTFTVAKVPATKIELNYFISRGK
jgi:hypothetical protein